MIARLLPALRVLPLFVAFVACTTGTGTASSSSGVAGLTYADIGTTCTCEVVAGANGYTCARNPTNTCPKSALTCVMAAPDPAFANAGHALYEYHLTTRQTNNADGGITMEGECTLLAGPTQQLICPAGTFPLQLTNGTKICKRQCQSDQECNRPGWVCDAPLLDRNGIDTGTLPSEIPLNVKMCKPGCIADFPDCLRVTPCTLGRPGCYRSALNINAPMGQGMYVGDRNGSRTCNATTGLCGPTLARNDLALAGNACASNADCPTQFLCISDYWWSFQPDGQGFCTYADCNPDAQPGAPGSCNPSLGLTCERAFEYGMCFPDCRGGTLCDVGQKCGTPDMGLILNLDPATGQQLPWKRTQCVQCDLTGSCP